MDKLIPVTKPFLPPIEEYMALVKRAYDNEWLTNRGELVLELESKIQEYLDSTAKPIAMNNGTIPLQIANVAVVSTHFVIIQKFTNGATSITHWLSDNTDPNGALTGALGDVCWNGASHKPAYNTDGGTTWVNFV